jgi:hypothetical protein
LDLVLGISAGHAFGRSALRRNSSPSHV